MLGKGDTEGLLSHYHLVSWQEGHTHQSLLQVRKRHQREPEQTKILHLQLGTRQFTCFIKLNVKKQHFQHINMDCPSLSNNVRPTARHSGREGDPSPRPIRLA